MKAQTSHTGFAAIASARDPLPRLRAQAESIGGKNAELNAFVAFELPDKISAPARGALRGLSFAVKDLIACAGDPVSFGLNPPAIPAAEIDAAVVTMFRELGGTLLGRTNLDAACLTYYGDSPHFGRIRNPLHPALPALGSSGGSAAAVAAGLVDFALGTDFGGSVRLPAAACGVCGLRCSPGFLPESGSLLISEQMDSLGLFTREIADLVWLLERSVDSARPTPLERVLVIGATGLAAIEPEVAEAYRVVVAGLRGRVEVEELTNSELFEDALSARRVIAARDFVRLLDSLPIDNATLPPAGRALVEYRRGISAEQIDAARSARDQVCDQLNQLLGPGTAIFTPSLPCVVPDWTVIQDGAESALQQRMNLFMALANVCGLPALALPLGPKRRSFQLVGCAGLDTEIARWGAQLSDWIYT